MNEAKAIARCEEAAALLPPRFRRAALQMPDHRKRYTEEFRLRAGQPPAALLPEGEVTLPYFGADSRVTPRDLAQMVDAVTDYSRYACAETLRQGFLCLHGGFRRIRLAPGEQRQVSFTLGDEALALIDPQGRRVVEKGDFVIAVGSSSQDIRLQTTVTLE